MNVFFKKLTKRLVSVIIVFAIIFTLGGCFNEPEPKRYDETRFAYTELTEQEKTLYVLMKEAVFNYDDVLTKGFGTLSVEDVTKVYEYLLIDYPEIFWVSGHSVIDYEEKDDLVTVTGFEFEYTMTNKEANEYITEIESITAPFLTEAQAMSTDYQKVLSAYEYIITLCEYDNDTYDLFMSGNIDDISLLPHNIVGVFVDNKAVCAGYAKAFQYLLNKLDIPVIYVTGETEDQSHAWNEVCIDGDWYFIDITWGDMVYSGTEALSDISYNYFGLTTNELLRTHTVTSELDLPECTATYYDYYRYNNLFLESYDFNEVNRIVSLAIESSQSSVQMKFASSQALSNAMQQLFENQDIFDIYEPYSDILVSDSARYVADQEGLVLKLIFDYK